MAKTFDDRAFAPVFKGWNVWVVAQKKDLGFNPLMVGISRDRQLRIWVEDQVRENAGGAELADPIAFKGSQVEILPARPTGLKSSQNKDQVPGENSLFLDAPADLRVVRFFNRGAPSRLVWPHDDDYLLDEVLQPDEGNPTTSGPPPKTITEDVTEPLKDIGAGVLTVVGVGVGALLLWKIFGGRK